MNKSVTMLFLLLAFITFALATSRNSTKKNIVCVERADTLKLVYGKDGRPGPPGEKGNAGRRGSYYWVHKSYKRGNSGLSGRDGLPGDPGEKGFAGFIGEKGETGIDGKRGSIGEKGERGDPGRSGDTGDPSELKGPEGRKGVKGSKGQPGGKMGINMEIYTLNSYSVAQSGYFNKLYRVKSRDLTDGRIDTGGWGSENEAAGNYIQATYSRPVYVTSFTVAGGFIPSWGHGVLRGYGQLDVEYSFDDRIWLKARTIPSPVQREMIFYDLPQPITAKYWRLKSSEDKWVGTTEFALRPLIRP